MSNERAKAQATTFQTAMMSSSATTQTGVTSNREYIPMETLYKWVKLAKSQALVIELLKLELDTLSDTIETGTSSITSNFHELTGHVRACANEALIAEASKSLSQVIRSLQYQDLASQLIDNICNTLQTLGHTFEFLLKETTELDQKGFESLSPDESYVNQIISERTLGEMRNRMTKNLEKISEVAEHVHGDVTSEGKGATQKSLENSLISQKTIQEPDTNIAQDAQKPNNEMTVELF